jgi:hypothetical protein
MYLPISCTKKYYKSLQPKYHVNTHDYVQKHYKYSGNDVLKHVKIIDDTCKYSTYHIYYLNEYELLCEPNVKLTKIEYGGFKSNDYYLFNGKKYKFPTNAILGVYDGYPLICKDGWIYYRDVMICEYKSGEYTLLANYLIKLQLRSHEDEEQEEEVDIFLLDIKSENPEFKLLDGDCKLRVLNLDCSVILHDNKFGIEISRYNSTNCNRVLMIENNKNNEKYFYCEILEYRNLIKTVFVVLRKKLSRGVARMIKAYFYGI